MAKKALNYMAIDENGKFVAVISSSAPIREIAKETSKWIRQNLSVERCDDDFVHKYFGKIIREGGINNAYRNNRMSKMWE